MINAVLLWIPLITFAVVLRMEETSIFRYIELDVETVDDGSSVRVEARERVERVKGIREDSLVWSSRVASH